MSCRDKVICPAFQSTYILDDSVRAAYFSYVWKLDQATRDKYLSTLYASADTTNVNVGGDPLKYYAYAGEYKQPAEQTSRTKYGIVKYEPNWLRNYEQKRAPMENVLRPKEEPVIVTPDYQDIGEFVAADFETDSLTAEDSLFIVAEVEPAVEEIPEKKGPKYLYKYDPNGDYNVEQEYYNKYFGKLLVEQPRPKPKPKAKPRPATDENIPEEAIIEETAVDSLSLPTEPVEILADTTGQ